MFSSLKNRISSCIKNISSRNRVSGFTLVELLIVVGILVTISTAAVMVINPAELIKQSNDSKRLADLAALDKSLSLYRVDNTGILASTSTVYLSLPDTNGNPNDNCILDYPTLPTLASPYTYHCATAATAPRMDGTGWIPVNLSNLSGGTPLSHLPQDPMNTASYYDAFIPGSDGSYVLTAKLESQKYLMKAQTDGGYDATRAETGSPVLWATATNLLDVTNPTVSTFSPADNATGASISADFTITFAEPVQVGTGNITLKKTDGTLIEAMDVTNPFRVSGSGSTVITINPTANLEYSTGYYVFIDATVFDDLAGNSYVGIADSSTWNFTTGGALTASVKVLVVAGGGGGGGGGSTWANGGGGGAGGLIYNSAFNITTQEYPITVGAGGSGGIGYNTSTGQNGGNSVFSSLIAVGGAGAPGWIGTSPLIGGSGAGGAGYTSTTSVGTNGTTNQGNNGGNGVNSATNTGNGGGGGGAGSAGSNSSGVYGGNGGLGLAYSISGVSVYYAGGGGGGAGTNGSGGAGGSGVGGAGGSTTYNGYNGVANRGGGGGGCGASGTGGAVNGGSGGSGIVIISYTTGALTATGGTITMSGGNTIHTFTSSGTFTVTNIGLDVTNPTVATLSPADNATDVSPTANLVITFSEAVNAATGTNNDIVIKKTSDNSVVETIDAMDAKVTGSGTDTITINPATALAILTDYYVQIGVDAFDDLAGNSYAGISDSTSWNFTTSIPTASVKTLVVAGGGGGGKGGGGGAGGVVYNAAINITTQAYTVTVGSGGSGDNNQYGDNSTNGNNSVFSSITAIGGGGGGGQDSNSPHSGTNGKSGGSGGGGGMFMGNGGEPYTYGGSGTSGQGYAGGMNNRIGNSPCGGGGGAGATAANATSVPSAGGIGVTNSISGTSVYYGGGGGGGSWGLGGAAGGLGGGGAGSTGQGTAGTANTGGGGGGGNGNTGGHGGNGGSGVVIVSYPDNGSITATGGNVTTSGGYKIHTFTSSGTFTVSAIN